MLRNLTLAVILLAAAFLVGCDSAVTPTERVEGYYLSGAVIKNMDRDELDVSAVWQRDDTLLPLAILNIDDDTLTYAGGKFYLSYESALSLSIGDYYLKLADSETYVDSVAFKIPSDFIINSKVPADTMPYRSGMVARIEWSTPTNVDGYAYGVVKRNLAYQDTGYAAFVTTELTSTAISVDAFRDAYGYLDTGWYYVYVYGWAGSPDPGQALPTKFAEGLTDNIDRPELTGRFGSVVVTRHDSFHVVTY